MEKSKFYLDLSKCSEDEQKHVFSLLPNPEKPEYYEVYNNYKYLQFIPASKFGNNRWMVDKQAFDKTELTYPEFVKLFEGGEGEKYSHDEIRKLAIERYGDDINSFGGQRDGFIEGFKKAMELNSNQ